MRLTVLLPLVFVPWMGCIDNYDEAIIVAAPRYRVEVVGNTVTSNGHGLSTFGPLIGTLAVYDNTWNTAKAPIRTDGDPEVYITEPPQPTPTPTPTNTKDSPASSILVVVVTVAALAATRRPRHGAGKIP